MIAYNKQSITNFLVLEKIKEWHQKKLLSDEQYEKALFRYQSNLYNPNIFIKLGIYIFTLIALSSGFGILSLFLTVFRVDYYYIVCFIYAIVCVVALEYSIRNTNHFKSGIQQALLYSAIGFLIPLSYKLFFYSLDNSNSILLICIFFLPILTAAIIRYSDRLVTFLFIACIYTVYFLLIMKLGSIAKLIMPFAFMFLSVVIHYFIKYLKDMNPIIYWKGCITVIEWIVPIIFYASGNYFVIREASVQFFDIYLVAGQDIPLAILFYLFTAIVPFCYIFLGLKQKNKILLWIGLLLNIATVFTFRHYYTFQHFEIKLTLLGLLLIVVSYVISKFLKIPRYGITVVEGYDETEFFSKNSEAIIIAQTFSPISHQKNNEFGGGSSSGGGASDSW